MSQDILVVTVILRVFTFRDIIDYCDERSMCLNAFNLFVLSTNFRRTDFVDFAKSWLIFQNGGGHRPR